jgi:alkylation response protein AidB-like acyl-CoA dehydrogenase
MAGRTDELQALASTVRALLDKRSDGPGVRRAVEQPKGYDEGLWQVLCGQVGAAGLAVPEEHGGAGGSLLETHVVLEELGAALTPSPFLGSAVLAGHALLLAGDETACRELLPGIADGSTVAALVWDGWSASAPPVTAAHEDGWVLNGTSRLVLDGDTADVLLVVADAPEGAGLFRVDPVDARRTHQVGMDLTLRYAAVELLDAPARLVSADATAFLPELRDVACVAVSALQVGTMQRCLDMTVAHARERVQFGRPIGSFQAIKHRLADLLVAVETSRSVSWAAAESAVRRTAGWGELAATAKSWCSEALNRVAAEAVQLHGGIAITWEHDAQLYFKRAHALSQLFGQPHEHRARLAPTWLSR